MNARRSKTKRIIKLKNKMAHIESNRLYQHAHVLDHTSEEQSNDAIQTILKRLLHQEKGLNICLRSERVFHQRKIQYLFK